MNKKFSKLFMLLVIIISLIISLFAFVNAEETKEEKTVVPLDEQLKGLQNSELSEKDYIQNVRVLCNDHAKEFTKNGLNCIPFLTRDKEYVQSTDSYDMIKAKERVNAFEALKNDFYSLSNQDRETKVTEYCNKHEPGTNCADVRSDNLLGCNWKGSILNHGQRICDSDSGTIMYCFNNGMIESDTCQLNGCSTDGSGNPVCNDDELNKCDNVGEIGCFPGRSEFKYCNSEGFWASSSCSQGSTCNVLTSSGAAACGVDAACCRVLYKDGNPYYECNPINNGGQVSSNVCEVTEVNPLSQGVNPALASGLRKWGITKAWESAVDSLLANSIMQNLDPERLICGSKQLRTAVQGQTVGQVDQFLSTDNFNIHWDGSYSPLFDNTALYTFSWVIKANEVPVDLNKKINGAVCKNNYECASGVCNKQTEEGLSDVGYCNGDGDTIENSIKQAVIFLLGDMDLATLKQLEKYAVDPSAKVDYGLEGSANDIAIKFIEYDQKSVFSAELDKPFVGSVEIEDQYKWDYVCMWFIPSHINNVPNNEILRPGILGCQPIVNRDIDMDVLNSDASKFKDSSSSVVTKTARTFDELQSLVKKQVEERTSNGVIQASFEIPSDEQFVMAGKLLGWPKRYKEDKLIREFTGDFPRATLIPYPKDLKDIVNNYFYSATGGQGEIFRSDTEIGEFDATQTSTIERDTVPLSVRQMPIEISNTKLQLEYEITFSVNSKQDPLDISVVVECDETSGIGIVECPSETSVRTIFDDTVEPSSFYLKSNEIVDSLVSEHIYTKAKLVVNGEVVQTVDIKGVSIPPSRCVKQTDKRYVC